MIEVNESNFDEETSSGLVLVDFYAAWCAPCRAIQPVLESLTGIKVVKVDVSSNKNLAVKYQVSAIPKLVFIKDGVVVDSITGLSNSRTLQQKIDNINEGRN